MDCWYIQNTTENVLEPFRLFFLRQGFMKYEWVYPEKRDNSFISCFD